MLYTAGTGSDPGKRKKLNEDAIFAASHTWHTSSSTQSFGLFILADGIAGYANGYDASCCAIQAIVDCIWPKMARSTSPRPKTCAALLTEAVQLANEAVNQENIRLRTRWPDPDVLVGATTTTAMLVGSTAYVANVGDCRTYLSRAGAGLKQITTDHLAITRLIEAGTLKPDDIYTHRTSYVVTRGLGDQPTVEVDLFTIEVQPGETLLLCSDGLWRMVRDPQIEDAIRHTPPDPSQTAEALIQSALDAGGKDNVSVIVVSMLEMEEQTVADGVQVFAKPESVQIPLVC